MVTVTGKSLIPINIEAFQQFISAVVPQGKLDGFVIKLDGRPRVKSVFTKLEDGCLTLYTGAIISQGPESFSEIGEVESLLMLFTIYGIKKAGKGELFEIKSNDAGVAGIKVDPDFQMLTGNLNLFMDRFKALSAQVVPPVQTSKSDEIAVTEVTEFKTTKKTRSTGGSPYKGIPLENTPKIEVPADLDLRMV